MQIPLTLFVMLFFVLVFVALLRRPWLLGVWAASFLLFPTAFTRIGEAPLYLFDTIAMLVLVGMWFGGDRSWPRWVPRWHWWFITSGFILSVVGGTLRYGAAPEILWIWGHASLSWMAFAFGVLVCTSDRQGEHCAAFRAGTLISSIALCGIALIQYADLPGAEIFSAFFYRDLGRAEVADILWHGAEVNRAVGPHSAPPGFAGMAVLTVLAFWLITDEEHWVGRWCVLVTSTTTMLCTVSRHAVLAVILGLAVMLALSEARKRTRLIAVGAILCLVLAGVIASSMLREGWSNRLAKTEEGVLSDDNIAARIIWGPARLAEFISRDPAVLLTGAGLNPEKLQAHSRLDSGFETGFVSNGFLLPLYYLGVFGFLLHGAFWVWILRVANRRSGQDRAVAVACVVTAGLLIASDNYGFMYQPAVSLLFLISGLIVGQPQQSPEEEAFASETAPAEFVEEAHAA